MEARKSGRQRSANKRHCEITNGAADVVRRALAVRRSGRRKVAKARAAAAAAPPSQPAAPCAPLDALRLTPLRWAQGVRGPPRQPRAGAWTDACLPAAAAPSPDEAQAPASPPQLHVWDLTAASFAGSTVLQPQPRRPQASPWEASHQAHADVPAPGQPPSPTGESLQPGAGAGPAAAAAVEQPSAKRRRLSLAPEQRLPGPTGAAEQPSCSAAAPGLAEPGNEAAALAAAEAGAAAPLPGGSPATATGPSRSRSRRPKAAARRRAGRKPARRKRKAKAATGAVQSPLQQPLQPPAQPPALPPALPGQQAEQPPQGAEPCSEHLPPTAPALQLPAALPRKRARRPPAWAREAAEGRTTAARERPVRVPGGTRIDHPAFQRLLDAIRSDSDCFEAEGRVLRLKQHMPADASPGMIEAIIDALAANSRVQALYIQNFERGMCDRQLGLLTEVLRAGRIWALNIGENFNISLDAWQRFARALPSTAVSFMYVSEHHLLRTDLKRQMRDAIRANRGRLPPLDPAVAARVTNCWWNPPTEGRQRKRRLRADAAEAAAAAAPAAGGPGAAAAAAEGAAEAADALAPPPEAAPEAAPGASQTAREGHGTVAALLAELVTAVAASQGSAPAAAPAAAPAPARVAGPAAAEAQPTCGAAAHAPEPVAALAQAAAASLGPAIAANPAPAVRPAPAAGPAAAPAAASGEAAAPAELGPAPVPGVVCAALVAELVHAVAASLAPAAALPPMPEAGAAPAE